MIRITLTAGLVAVLMLPGAARAESTILTGACGPADIERACQSAGGRPTGDGVTSYGCVKDNCDGRGGQYSVTSVGPLKCLAETPAPT